MPHEVRILIFQPAWFTCEIVIVPSLILLTFYLSIFSMMDSRQPNHHGMIALKNSCLHFWGKTNIYIYMYRESAAESHPSGTGSERSAVTKLTWLMTDSTSCLCWLSKPLPIPLTLMLCTSLSYFMGPDFPDPSPRSLPVWHVLTCIDVYIYIYIYIYIILYNIIYNVAVCIYIYIYIYKHYI